LNGEIVGSIGISAPILRVTPAANQTNAESVSRVAQKIGEILGALQEQD
jgi:DNA-binding IclR family transcriptional regulator